MLFDTDSGGSKYEIQKSLRFRANASAYLSRTPTVAGNRKTWTWSGWVKRGSSGAISPFFGYGVSGVLDYFGFNAADQLFYFSVDSSGAVARANYTTTAVFRDPAAWYHVVVTVDTTQATAANRLKIYVNGVLQVLTASYSFVQNWDTYINNALPHGIAFTYDGGNRYFDGYLSEVNFIDGQALDPSYFGQVSAETGQWIPKKYTGTYGTNGFYLPFNDGSNLTSLTADRSGNGNNWTASNISLTSGSSYDWMDDTPTNNYPVLSPIANSGYSPVDGNLRVETNIAYQSCPATILLPTSGQFYFEYNCINADATLRDVIGIIDVTSARTIVHSMTNSAGYDSWSGQVYQAGSLLATYATWANGAIIQVAIDCATGKYWFGKNNTWNGVPTAGTGNAGTLVNAGNLAFCLSNSGDGNSYYTTRGHMNFGQRPFAYAPPAGFKALCTKNLPAPSILNPKKHFDVRTRTGTGAAATVTGIPFAPDLVWIKSRAAAYSHNITDSVRGAAKTLISNATAAEEQTRTVGYVSAFTPDGYSLSAGSSNIDEVGATTTYVDWLWKAGGAPVANNAGSIQSQVSANPQAGFSIVTYTGNGVAGATIGHGLGVKPKLVIVKMRGGITNWCVWHDSLTLGNSLYLNLTNGQGADAAVWNSTAPTSSVFSVGTHVATNQNTIQYVAYCFAEVPGFSKIGSYIGNGSADGPFVYCGFRPKWLLFKSTGTGTRWIVLDATRDLNNQINNTLAPNFSNAEYVDANWKIDFTANGFKVRSYLSGDTEWNYPGSTYIFYAIAEQPFQFANAR